MGCLLSENINHRAFALKLAFSFERLHVRMLPCLVITDAYAINMSKQGPGSIDPGTLEEGDLFKESDLFEDGDPLEEFLNNEFPGQGFIRQEDINKRAAEIQASSNPNAAASNTSSAEALLLNRLGPGVRVFRIDDIIQPGTSISQNIRALMQHVMPPAPPSQQFANILARSEDFENSKKIFAENFVPTFSESLKKIDFVQELMDGLLSCYYRLLPESKTVPPQYQSLRNSYKIRDRILVGLNLLLEHIDPAQITHQTIFHQLTILLLDNLFEQISEQNTILVQCEEGKNPTIRKTILTELKDNFIHIGEVFIHLSPFMKVAKIKKQYPNPDSIPETELSELKEQAQIYSQPIYDELIQLFIPELHPFYDTNVKTLIFRALHEFYTQNYQKALTTIGQVQKQISFMQENAKLFSEGTSTSEEEILNILQRWSTEVESIHQKCREQAEQKAALPPLQQFLNILALNANQADTKEIFAENFVSNFSESLKEINFVQKLMDGLLLAYTPKTQDPETISTNYELLRTSCAARNRILIGLNLLVPYITKEHPTYQQAFFRLASEQRDHYYAQISERMHMLQNCEEGKDPKARKTLLSALKDNFISLGDVCATLISAVKVAMIRKKYTNPDTHFLKLDEKAKDYTKPKYNTLVECIISDLYKIHLITAKDLIFRAQYEIEQTNYKTAKELLKEAEKNISAIERDAKLYSDDKTISEQDILKTLKACSDRVESLSKTILKAEHPKHFSKKGKRTATNTPALSEAEKEAAEAKRQAAEEVLLKELTEKKPQKSKGNKRNQEKRAEKKYSDQQAQKAEAKPKAEAEAKARAEAKAEAEAEAKARAKAEAKAKAEAEAKAKAEAEAEARAEAKAKAEARKKEKKHKKNLERKQRREEEARQAKLAAAKETLTGWAEKQKQQAEKDASQQNFFLKGFQDWWQHQKPWMEFTTQELSQAFENLSLLDKDPSAYQIEQWKTRSRYNNLPKIEIPEYIQEMIQRVEDNGYHMVVYGGFVRDRLHGVSYNDIDLMTDCPGPILQELFQGLMCDFPGSSRYQFLEKSYPDQIEINVVEAFDLAKHARKSFLAVNGLYATREGILLDPLNLLVKQRLSQNLEPTGNILEDFREDPSRILRVVNCATHLNKPLAPQAIQAMSDDAIDWGKIPFGVLRCRLQDLLLRGHAEVNFKFLYDFGLIQKILRLSDEEAQAYRTVCNDITVNNFIAKQLKRLAAKHKDVSLIYPVFALLLLSLALRQPKSHDWNSEIAQYFPDSNEKERHGIKTALDNYLKNFQIKRPGSTSRPSYTPSFNSLVNSNPVAKLNTPVHSNNVWPPLAEASQYPARRGKKSRGK